MTAGSLSGVATLGAVRKASRFESMQCVRCKNSAGTPAAGALPQGGPRRCDGHTGSPGRRPDGGCTWRRALL